MGYVLGVFGRRRDRACWRSKATQCRREVPMVHGRPEPVLFFRRHGRGLMGPKVAWLSAAGLLSGTELSTGAQSTDGARYGAHVDEGVCGSGGGGHIQSSP